MPQRLLSKTTAELCKFKFSQQNPSSEGKEYVSKPIVNKKKKKEIHRKQILQSYFIGPSGTLTFCHSVLTGGHCKEAALVAFDRLQCSWPTQLGENLCSRAWLQKPHSQTVLLNQNNKARALATLTAGMTLSSPHSRSDMLPLRLSPFTSIPYTQTMEQASVGDPCPQELLVCLCFVSFASGLGNRILLYSEAGLELTV